MRIQIALLVFAFVAVIWAAPVQNKGNYMIKSDMVCGCQNICSNVVFVYTCEVVSVSLSSLHLRTCPLLMDALTCLSKSHSFCFCQE